jgi:hypothetical protein
LRAAHGHGAVAYSHGNRALFHRDSERGVSAQYDTRRRLIVSLVVLKKDLLKLWMFFLRYFVTPYVIFDRYTDDAIAKFRFYHAPIRWLEWLARRFAPPANLIIWLDVTAEVSQARDREHPFSYHERKRDCYTSVFSKPSKRSVLHIDGRRSVNEIQATIKERMRESGWL